MPKRKKGSSSAGKGSTTPWTYSIAWTTGGRAGTLAAKQTFFRREIRSLTAAIQNSHGEKKFKLQEKVRKLQIKYGKIRFR
ncbi:MAG TPA: hypothetical protein VFF13_05405 [archaeon]|nr:hypothetical protein [archaeon]